MARVARGAADTVHRQALVERQNKELSDLLWKRGDGERLLVAAETAYAQVFPRFYSAALRASVTRLFHLQESAAAAALMSGAEGPEHLKDAEARLKKLDKELQEERQ